MTQDHLARRIFINKSNVARQLVFLETSGFVERRPSQDDKRTTLVFPTQKALDVFPKIRQTFRDWESLVAADLTQEQQAQMILMLEKMKAQAIQWMEEQ